MPEEKQNVLHSLGVVMRYLQTKRSTAMRSLEQELEYQGMDYNYYDQQVKQIDETLKHLKVHQKELENVRG